MRRGYLVGASRRALPGWWVGDASIERAATSKVYAHLSRKGRFKDVMERIPIDLITARTAWKQEARESERANTKGVCIWQHKSNH